MMRRCAPRTRKARPRSTTRSTIGTTSSLSSRARAQRTTGHGFVGIGRKQLLEHPAAALRGARRGARIRARGRIRTSNSPTPTSSWPPTASIRRSVTDTPISFCPISSVRPNRYIWLGVAKRVRRVHLRLPQDRARLVPGAHLQVRLETSTFIVETTEDAFEAHGLGELDQDGSIAFCEKLFAETLDGAKLMTNARHLRGSAWLNFNAADLRPVELLQRPSHVVLMGDAAHTAHFAIGSGTKLAIDDAIELARQFDARRPYGRRIFRRCSRLTRRCAASMSRASRTRRATRWNGSRWSAGATAISSSREQFMYSHADALAAHQPRELAAARQGLAGGLRALVRRARPALRSTTTSVRRRRCSRPIACAA